MSAYYANGKLGSSFYIIFVKWVHIMLRTKLGDFILSLLSECIYYANGKVGSFYTIFVKWSAYYANGKVGPFYTIFVKWVHIMLKTKLGHCINAFMVLSFRLSIPLYIKPQQNLIDRAHFFGKLASCIGICIVYPLFFFSFFFCFGVSFYA